MIICEICEEKSAVFLNLYEETLSSQLKLSTKYKILYCNACDHKSIVETDCNLKKIEKKRISFN
jgi:hypothetical protein